MTLMIIIFLLALSQLFVLVFEYDSTSDNKPNNLFHKIIRALNKWIVSNDEIS